MRAPPTGWRRTGCSKRPRATRSPPGQREKAYELAERSLYESLMARGRQGAVLEWLARLPADELDRRPRLLLAAAWSLALSERHEEASRLVERILAQPGVDDALRCECALILSGAAVFADDPDRFAELHDPWASDPPLRDPLLLQVHANRSAFRTLLEGEPALARLRQQQAPRGDLGAALGYIGRWGDFIIGLTYLWEGQVLLAEKLLRPDAGARRGRPRPAQPVRLHAGGAAGRGALGARPAATRPAALLANRLDVLERSGLPEAVLLGFPHAWRASPAPRAPSTARSSCWARSTPSASPAACRACASPAWPTRCACMRAASARETCRDLCARIDALLADAGAAAGPAVAAQRRRCCATWRSGYAAIAAQDWRARRRAAGARRGAGAASSSWAACTSSCSACARWRSTAAARSRCGLLREAVDLARAYGLLRVFDDAHPGARRLGAPGAAPAAPGAAGRAGALPRRRAPAARDAARPRHARAWRSRRRSARCWSCSRATCPTRRSGWPCRWAKRRSSGT